MRIAVISTYDFEGGAARAAFRLHQAIEQNKLFENSKLIVQKKNN